MYHTDFQWEKNLIFTFHLYIAKKNPVLDLYQSHFWIVFFFVFIFVLPNFAPHKKCSFFSLPYFLLCRKRTTNFSFNLILSLKFILSISRIKYLAKSSACKIVLNEKNLIYFVYEFLRKFYCEMCLVALLLTTLQIHSLFSFLSNIYK